MSGGSVSGGVGVRKSPSQRGAELPPEPAEFDLLYVAITHLSAWLTKEREIVLVAGPGIDNSEFQLFPTHACGLSKKARANTKVLLVENVQKDRIYDDVSYLLQEYAQ